MVFLVVIPAVVVATEVAPRVPAEPQVAAVQDSTAERAIRRVLDIRDAMPEPEEGWQNYLRAHVSELQGFRWTIGQEDYDRWLVDLEHSMEVWNRNQAFAHLTGIREVMAPHIIKGTKVVRPEPREPEIPEEVEVPVCEIGATVLWIHPSSLDGPAAWGIESDQVWYQFQPRVEGRHISPPTDVWFVSRDGRRHVEMTFRGDRWWAPFAEIDAIGPGNFWYGNGRMEAYSSWGRGAKYTWIAPDDHTYIMSTPAWDTHVDTFSIDPEERKRFISTYRTHERALRQYRICPYNVGNYYIDFSGQHGVRIINPEPNFVYTEELRPTGPVRPERDEQ